MSHLNNYIIGKTIGRGSFAKVKSNFYSESTHVATGLPVAFKIINWQSDKKRQESLLKETKILQSLRHPHIITLYELIKTTKQLILVLEYAPQSDLYTLIDSSSKLSEQEARRLFQQLATAVKYLHKKGIAHRDIKPENILLDQQLDVKLADFGFSTKLPDGEYLKTDCGTIHYSAPEVHSGQPYCGTSADIWSLGVMLYVMVAGRLPFDQDNCATLIYKISSGEYHCPMDFSSSLVDLIARMLDTNPVTRLTIQQVVKHPWVSLDIPSYLLNDRYVERIDEEVYKECLKLKEFKNLNVPERLIKSRIAARRQDTFTVAYEILADSKSNKKNFVFSSNNNSETPLFSEMNESTIEYHLGTKRWNYGICYSLTPHIFARELFKAFRDIGFEWKMVKYNSWSVRKGNIRFSLNILQKNYETCADLKLEEGNLLEFFDHVHRLNTLVLKSLLN